MAIALLELTQHANGDVLERLVVVTFAEATAWPLQSTKGEVICCRLFAQTGNGVPSVPPSVRALLERVALSSLEQLAKCRDSEEQGVPGPSVALWKAGVLQRLEGLSLTESFAVWLQRSGTTKECVLIELQGPPPAAATAIAPDVEPSYTRLRDGLAKHILRRDGALKVADMDPGAAVRPGSARIENVGPSQQILIDAAGQREWLSAQWLSAAQVSARLGFDALRNCRSASQLRRDGQLLGAFVTHPVPGYRYPGWQFLPDGRPIDQLAAILRVLRDCGFFHRESSGLHRTTGWGEVECFFPARAARWQVASGDVDH